MDFTLHNEYYNFQKNLNICRSMFELASDD